MTNQPSSSLVIAQQFLSLSHWESRTPLWQKCHSSLVPSSKFITRAVAVALNAGLPYEHAAKAFTGFVMVHLPLEQTT
ncbi:hypothetical protein K239x_23470 [Planctomycetes bacterium K23_9]|uniref:Uncharacterized protein n=1 Tax=Stieleria marina TaxID=1930275 RepID=A0A517NTE6_9BACT|nr:hypothetical protein K239x_23470 [Planctomycetes bacterium K23_9]